MKKNVIIAVLSLLVVAVAILIFVRKPILIDDAGVIDEPVVMELDSVAMAGIYEDYPEAKEAGDVIMISINLRRVCYRDIMGRAWGTYYPVARSYWKLRRKPFVCKYIRIEHSIYGAARRENTDALGHIPQQRRHCRAHHLKAWFNLYGNKEYFIEHGQN